MGSAKNGSWIIPFKKFGMVRVKDYYIKRRKTFLRVLIWFEQNPAKTDKLNMEC